ncbi:hypothetical protein GCM10023165_12990 [Variovorax defluvii]|uniref:Uncharacterized protein n=2 Tax=Variovorax defluvii TaxID=913761 RepID=A0ABP8H917_9BURK
MPVFGVQPPSILLPTLSTGGVDLVSGGKPGGSPAFKLAPPEVVHAWTSASVSEGQPATPKAGPVDAPITPEGAIESDPPHDGAVPAVVIQADPVDPVQADVIADVIPADALPKPAAPAEKAAIRKSETFGLDPAQLNADRIIGTKRFLGQYDHARKLEHRAKHSTHYKAVETSHLRDDGSLDKAERWVPAQKTRAQRIQSRNRKDGERVKRGYNHLTGWVREMAGRPRKTGSNYGSKKGRGALVAPATLVPADVLGGGTAIGKCVTGAVRAGPTYEQPAVLPSAVGVGDGLGFAGLGSTVADAMDAADGVLTMVNRRTGDKANLVRYHEDALRFRRLLDESTPEEAEAFLKFENSAQRLIKPTPEEQATDAVTRDYAIRSLGLNPVSSGVSVGAQVAGYVGPACAAAGLAWGPLGLASGSVDLSQAIGEHARRKAQVITAVRRKHVIEAVSGELDDAPGAPVLRGALASLWKQQDRLERQGKYEIDFSIARGVKAVANMFVGTAGTAVAGLAVAGVVATSVTTPLAIGLAVPAVVGGGFIAGRSWVRHEAESRSKGRECAAAAAIQSLTREQLEALLSRPSGEPAEVTVSIGEGEYLPGEDRFAGERTITFDVRDNEYVGLHMVALQIQDLIRTGDAKAAAPWLKTLRGLGVDSVRLLAICKAASAKPAEEQLDFIKTYLAPPLGIKHRMTGAQAHAHPSVFLGRFQNALLDAGIGKKARPSPSAYRRVREELVKQFGEGEAAMAAFKSATSEFIRKTAKLPSSPLRSHLRAFLVLEQFTASGRAVPEVGADEVIEYFRGAPADADFDAHVLKKLTTHGLRDPEQLALVLQLGVAGLTNLPASEAARIEAQANALLRRLEAL